MSTRELLGFFNARKDDEHGLVLASVYDTLGSTYSKAGDRMLVAGNGDFQGMLSGGCLEGDLAERAMQVATSGECQTVTYDLRQNDEELWGLGVGCEGLMRIFLQPLIPAAGFEPFTSMLDVLEGDKPGVAAVVLATDDPQTAAGAALVGTSGSYRNLGLSRVLESVVTEAAESACVQDRSVHTTVVSDGVQAELLCAILRPAPRILVLGGGLDVEPVVRQCVGLGWRVTVQDHRPAYIDKGDFAGAEQVLCEPAAELSRVVDLDRFDAVIVMSHHLATDRCYLEQLAESRVGYIGLLGPVDRRRRLMDDLGARAAKLADRLHGPAGLPLGGRGPSAIALSIIAQMHEVLMRASAERVRAERPG